jgi:hypothetical protein
VLTLRVRWREGAGGEVPLKRTAARTFLIRAAAAKERRNKMNQNLTRVYLTLREIDFSV